MAMRTDPSRLYSLDHDVHGSAQWADRAYLRTRHFGENQKIFLGYGLPEHKKMGAYPITTSTQRHILTVAPTRSGKLLSSSAIQCLDHQGSLVAIDTKDGELAKITALYRRDELGQNLIVIDPWNVACPSLGIQQSCINFIDWLNPEDEDFYDKALVLTEAMVIAGNNNDPHWDDEALYTTLAGLAMYVAATPTVMMPTHKKSRDLAQIRRLLNLPPKAFQEMLAGKFELDEDGNSVLIHPGMTQSPNEHVSAAAARMLNKAPKEFSSVLSTAQRHTHFLENPLIQQATNRSDFTPEDLANGNMSIYIVMPMNRIRKYNRFSRLMINRLMEAVMDAPVKPNPSVYFLLEEMPALKRMDVIEQAVSTVAGYGIQMHMFAQDFSQLYHTYSGIWQTLIANCGVIQCFGTNDLMTAEYLSKRCGRTTLENLSEASAEQRAGIFSDPNYFSREDSQQGRPLITPEEIMALHSSLQLLILAGSRPAICYKSVYFLDKRYRDKRGMPLFGIDPNHADKPLPRPIDLTRKGLDIGTKLDAIYGGA